MDKILDWLPEKPQALWVRYGSATIMVALCLGSMHFVEAQSGLSSFFLLYPAIFLTALLFDRGSGFYAAVLSTLLIIIQGRYGLVSLNSSHWLPLSLFLLIGLGIAALTELLRKGWEKAVTAEKTQEVLCRELGHRTKNDFAMAASVLNLQARSQTNADVKGALGTAVGRLLTLSKAHERLSSLSHGTKINMRDYVEAVGQTLLEDAANVSLRTNCDEIELPPDRAVPVGLIVNELVTNAVKHAFRDQHDGLIRVSLRGGDPLSLIVEDNGAGCPDSSRGVGSHLVELLVAQLSGRMERNSAGDGCKISISFPA
jgi:two-component sensor histidine kinase